ncbi:hypothetical protein CONLIGDRAFT_491191 [Coniochaeta ligniaria NRRL 30616]|uniref:Uncharacterized protein n=1 Tax=Coniochaeta ligniaria NRRL 30616 TaxID=1408157 RepID=A0A1J7J0K0_9PEZI|nr:hypothetical protein CONLIGDRAFT_491191 [Coniochaeta ligniaria NRRL 30616]
MDTPALASEEMQALHEHPNCAYLMVVILALVPLEYLVATTTSTHSHCTRILHASLENTAFALNYTIGFLALHSPRANLNRCLGGISEDAPIRCRSSSQHIIETVLPIKLRSRSQASMRDRTSHGALVAYSSQSGSDHAPIFTGMTDEEAETVLPQPVWT